jgi:hypothetical protein
MRRALLALATVGTIAFAVPVMATTPPVLDPGTRGHVKGTVVFKTPDVLYVDTDMGLRKFDVTDQSRGLQSIGTGDQVEVWYVAVAGEKGYATVERLNHSAEVSPQPPERSEPKSTQVQPPRPPQGAAATAPAPALQPSPQAPKPATTQMAAAAARLPQTASELPVVALIGFVSLAGALGARVLRGR